MGLPAGAVLVKDYEIRPRVFRVTLCVNHLAYGKYDAYMQDGGAAYKVYPVRCFHSEAPRGKFFANTYDFATDYAYY